MSKKTIVYKPKSLEDITEIVTYLANNNNPNIVQTFHKQLEQTCALLADMPGIGTVRDFKNTHLVGVRFHPLKQFDKYLVFYRTIEKNTIEIIRIVHGARDLPAVFEENEE